MKIKFEVVAEIPKLPDELETHFKELCDEALASAQPFSVEDEDGKDWEITGWEVNWK